MSFGDIKFNVVSIPDWDFRKLLKEHMHKGNIADGTVTGIPSECGGGGLSSDCIVTITNSGGSWTAGIHKEVAKYLESTYEQAIKSEERRSAFEYLKVRGVDDLVIDNNPIKKTEYVNIMLMEEVHKIDKDKLWASIRAFGDGGIG